MPWGSVTMNKLRKDFVIDVEKDIGSFSSICKKYNITRKTGYKWYYRFKNGESLSDKSRKPFNTPNKISEDMEQLILSMRDRHPYWGARKLRKIAENEYKFKIPSVTTFSNVLKRNNRISEIESQTHKPFIRYEKKFPNDMWQMDFKGQFKMNTEEYCYPLTIKDDNSRYGIAVDAKLNQKSEGVKESLIKAFRYYGLPKSILFDNGKPWGDSKKYSYTSIEVWLMELDILPKHGRMLHPQTQGKIESFNKALKREVLDMQEIKDITDAQEVFNNWLYQYNNIRPHESIGLKVPAEQYRKSQRKYPDVLEEFRYDEEYEITKVNRNGYIKIKEKLHFFSEAFIGKNVALIKELDNPNQINIHFRNFSIAVFDTESNKIIKKSIRRLE